MENTNLFLRWSGEPNSPIGLGARLCVNVEYNIRYVIIEQIVKRLLSNHLQLLRRSIKECILSDIAFVLDIKGM